MPKPNARLTLRLTSVTSNVEPERYMALKIEDAASGQIVAQFELLGEHLLGLLSGREVGALGGIPAFLIEEQDRRHLGKVRTVIDRRFSMTDYNEDTVTRWAGLNAGALGFDEFTVTRNNAHQYVVSFRLYAEPEHIERLRVAKEATVAHLAPPAIESNRRRA